MEADESRVFTVGNKRSLNGQNLRSRKRRRKDTDKRKVTDFVLNGGSFSSLAQSQVAEPHSNYPADTTPQPDSSTVMAGSFGNNRLLTGFSKASTLPDSIEQLHGVSNSPAAEVAESADSVIEISDEDMEDSEGGIVINIQERNKPDIINVSDDEDGDEREDIDEREDNDESDDSEMTSRFEQTSQRRREMSVGVDTHNSSEEPSFVIDTSPVSLHKKLSDLSREEREDQLKYAFYHLDRDQIDLGRPVLCLQCFSEGHLHTDCNEPSEPFTLKCKDDAQIKLWISCCVCASKTHLVGDCPHAETSTLQRWSLASLKPEQIINMSLETGTRQLEKEAETRGMRPTGLSIKGRAGRHTAGVTHDTANDSSDDEPFLRSNREHQENSRRPRYDRYTAPSGPSPSQNRGRGPWYDTDSFGRRRSRSPELDHRTTRDRRSPSPHADSWRPNTSDGRDSYRPPPPPSPRDHRDGFPGRNVPGRPPPPNQRPRAGRAPTSVRPAPTSTQPSPPEKSTQNPSSTSRFSMQLPSRPGQGKNKNRNRNKNSHRGKSRGGGGGGK